MAAKFPQAQADFCQRLAEIHCVLAVIREGAQGERGAFFLQ